MKPIAKRYPVKGYENTYQYSATTQFNCRIWTVYNESGHIVGTCTRDKNSTTIYAFNAKGEKTGYPTTIVGNALLMVCQAETESAKAHYEEVYHHSAEGQRRDGFARDWDEEEANDGIIEVVESDAQAIPVEENHNTICTNDPALVQEFLEELDKAAQGVIAASQKYFESQRIAQLREEIENGWANGWGAEKIAENCELPATDDITDIIHQYGINWEGAPCDPEGATAQQRLDMATIAHNCAIAVVEIVKANAKEIQIIADEQLLLTQAEMEWYSEKTNIEAADAEAQGAELAQWGELQTLLSDCFVVAATGETIAAKAGYTIAYSSQAGRYKLIANNSATLVERDGVAYGWCWVNPADAAPALRACEPQAVKTIINTVPSAVPVAKQWQPAHMEIKTSFHSWGVQIFTKIVRGDEDEGNALHYSDTAVSVETWRGINSVDMSMSWHPILAAHGTPQISNPNATPAEIAAFWVGQIENFCQMWQKLAALLHALLRRQELQAALLDIAECCKRGDTNGASVARQRVDAANNRYSDAIREEWVRRLLL